MTWQPDTAPTPEPNGTPLPPGSLPPTPRNLEPSHSPGLASSPSSLDGADLAELLGGRFLPEIPEAPPRFASLRGLLTGGKVGRIMLLLAGGIVLLGGGIGAAAFMTAFHTPRTDLVTHAVKRERLLLSIVERGSLEAANNNDIYCRVKARSQNSTISTTIRWVIDNGTHVKPGQLLVELDDSGLQEQRKQQQIVVDQARAAWIQAEGNERIQLIQNERDLKDAELLVKLAAIDVEKYQKGDYLQTLADIRNRRLLAVSDLEMLKDRAAWAERMAKKGYYSPTQVLSELARMEGADVNLKKIDEERRVLEYTRDRTLTDLENKLQLARLDFKRVAEQARVKAEQAAEDVRTKRKVYDQENDRLEEIKTEIAKCQIFAPQEGMVVYFMPEQSRFGSGSQQSIVAQGEPVREGQKLMSIPDLSRMLVNTKVNEALVLRVRGEEYLRTGFSEGLRAGAMLSASDPLLALARMLRRNALPEPDDDYRDQVMQKVYDGNRAQIRIDAFPGKPLKGHVKSVATVNSQQDWSSADVKVYQTMVAIDDSLEGLSLKPGMSAEVTIFSDKQVDDVLAVPVQAVVSSPEMGPVRKVYVVPASGGEPEERDVVLGMSNDKMVEVQQGLQEGDLVVVNAKALYAERHKGKAPAGGEKVDPGPLPKGAGGPGGPGGGRGPGGRPPSAGQ